MKVLEEKARTLTVLVMCQHFSDKLLKFGYREGMGEIGLFRFFRERSTFVKVYHEWRGNGFSVQNHATWPVPKKDLDMMIRRFRSINVTSAQ